MRAATAAALLFELPPRGDVTRGPADRARRGIVGAGTGWAERHTQLDRGHHSPPTPSPASMTAASVLISKAETEWVAGGFAAGTRGDGRGRGSARSLELATGGLPQASGSAEVRLGLTHVVVAVQASSWSVGLAGKAAARPPAAATRPNPRPAAPHAARESR